MDSNRSTGIVVRSFVFRSLQNGINRVGGREKDAVKGGEEEMLAIYKREEKD